jgi:hypothetical protein
MSHNKRFNLLIFTLFLALIPLFNLGAWPAHPLLAGAALRNHPHWKNSSAVQTKTLAQFVIDNKDSLATFLASLDRWNIANMPHYLPVPEALAFSADVDTHDALQQFLMAIRINPNVKVPLFLHIAPGSHSPFPEINPSKVTTLSNLSGMKAGTYVALEPGIFVDPFMVLITANDEPDYGFDLGLFEDNNTDYGRLYGFGKQTFGNPNLEYSSQAPFHMGFYHEPGIVFKFAPFLHKTFLNYRYTQFKALAAFAFRQNEPYWGYRFLGWSMHYLADATMPYHIRPLPGYRTLHMLWINLKSMLNFKKAQRNAIQLVSNRHTAIEDYLQQRLVAIYQNASFDDPLYQALTKDQTIQHTHFNYLVDQATKKAFDGSKSFDKAVRRGLPNEMVNDPKIEVSRHQRISDIVAYTNQVNQPKSIQAMEHQVQEQFVNLGVALRSLLSTFDSEIKNSNQQPIFN